jgi:NitT/TauT family transport system ATP-binding protein
MNKMETESQDAPLRFERMSFRYPAAEDVLRDIDFSIGRGSFVSLVGPSGCGKSTLLRLAAGVLSPVAGAVRRGQDSVGFVFQSPTLLPWRTVLDNVALPMELADVSRRERMERARRLVELVGLSDAAGRFPAQLSGGMRMRVSIARALSSRPRLLLMDEPFAALDDMTRSRLQEELLALREREEFATLFVTHNIAESVFLSDRVLCFSARPGRIVGEVGISRDVARDDEWRTDVRAAEKARAVSRLLHGGVP